jgi:TRAP-type C4-dicarboxylate transport system substrate-binding protein
MTDLSSQRALMVTDIPATHVRVPYLRRMAQQLNGDGLPCRLEIDGQRHAGRQALDAVRAGTARMAWVNASHLEALAPALALFNLPFFLDDEALGAPGHASQALRVLDDATAPHGLRTLGLMRGADQLFAAPRTLRAQPEALHGLRIRVAGPGIYEAIMHALGAVPVPLPIPRIGQALAAGVLDALFTSPGGWQVQLGLRAPHALRVPGLMLINYVLVVDAPWFAALPAAARSALRQAADLQVTQAWQAMARDDEEVLAAMERTGAQIVVAGETESWRGRLTTLNDRHFAAHPHTAATLHALVHRR